VSCAVTWWACSHLSWDSGLQTCPASFPVSLLHFCGCWGLKLLQGFTAHEGGERGDTGRGQGPIAQGSGHQEVLQKKKKKKRVSREQGKREVTGVSPEDTSLCQVWRLGQCQHLRAVRRVLYWCFRLRAYQGMPWFSNPSAWPGMECQVGNGCHYSQSTRCHRSGIKKDCTFIQHKTQWSGTCFQSRS